MKLAVEKENHCGRRIDDIVDHDEKELLNALLSPRLNSVVRKKTVADLFGKFSSLRQMIHAPRRTLKAATASGAIAHEELQRARELAIALAKVEIRQQPVLKQYDSIIDYCRTFLAGERRERFYALYLNKARYLTGCHCLQSGTIDHVSIYPRELFDSAMEHAAASIILVHNHPGGSPTPSRADVIMTRNLAQVGHCLGITLIDHIIIGSAGTYSFRRNQQVAAWEKSNPD